jgi:hypothetical protein
LDILSLANLLSGVTLIASAVGPLIISLQSKIASIRNLTLLLSGFLLTHGAHHLVWFLGYVWLSHEILEPISVFFVILFALYLATKTVPLRSPKISKILPTAAATSGVVSLIALPLVGTGPDITAVELFVSFALFAFMVYKQPSIHSFHFQFAAFLALWAISETIYTIQQFNFLTALPFANAGAIFHFASMAAVGIFVNYRMFGSLKALTAMKSVASVGKK